MKLIEELIGLAGRLEDLKYFIENEDDLKKVCEIHEFFEKVLSKFDNIEQLIKMFDIAVNNPYIHKEILTTEETSKMLGITERRLRIWCDELDIPHMKVNNKNLYFRQSELLDWIKNFKVLTKKELDIEARKHLAELGKRQKK